jgi:hypothetical protein
MFGPLALTAKLQVFMAYKLTVCANAKNVVKNLKRIKL